MAPQLYLVKNHKEPCKYELCGALRFCRCKVRTAAADWHLAGVLSGSEQQSVPENQLPETLSKRTRLTLDCPGMD